MKGIAIVLLSTLCLSPDSLFFRLLTINVWDILFWRGALVAVGIFLFLKLIKIPVISTLREAGIISLLIIACDTASNLFFYLALHFTSVADTLIILSTIPIIAAILGQFFLGDKTRIRTWVAMGVIFLSVVLLVSGNTQKSHWIGDLFALGAAFFLAIALIGIRQCRSLDMTPCLGIANVLTALAALPLAHPLSIFYSGIISSTLILLLLMGLFSTLALIFLVISPRYVNAAEASLFLPLETVLGAGLVWIFIGEVVHAPTLIGGAIILATVFIYFLREYQESKRTKINVNDIGTTLETLTGVSSSCV